MPSHLEETKQSIPIPEMKLLPAIDRMANALSQLLEEDLGPFNNSDQ